MHGMKERSDVMQFNESACSAGRPKVDDWTGEFSPEGWITRAGKFIPCDYAFLHGLAAWMALGGEEKTAELRAEKMGWLRLSDYGDRTCKPLNQSQMNTLFDYCEAMSFDYKEVIEGIKFL